MPLHQADGSVSGLAEVPFLSVVSRFSSLITLEQDVGNTSISHWSSRGSARGTVLL